MKSLMQILVLGTRKFYKTAIVFSLRDAISEEDSTGFSY